MIRILAKTDPEALRKPILEEKPEPHSTLRVDKTAVRSIRYYRGVCDCGWATQASTSKAAVQREVDNHATAIAYGEAG